jgi:hypothetical protein
MSRVCALGAIPFRIRAPSCALAFGQSLRGVA